MSAKKFRGKYRIPSARLKNHDYGSPGAYFVTIVTRNRENFFGEIRNGKIILSEIGKIARDDRYKSPEIRPDMNIILDAFVIMPNHIHGIMIIGTNKYNSGKSIVSARLNSYKYYQNQFSPKEKLYHQSTQSTNSQTNFVYDLYLIPIT